MPSDELCERIAVERNCHPDLVRAILGDALYRWHERSVKEGVGAVLFSAPFDLAPEAAWHLLGLLIEGSECEEGELIEHYQRIAPELARFSTVHERWRRELELDARRTE